jgi:hypothetical protein
MIALSFVFILVFPAFTGLIEIPILDYLPVAVLLALFTPVMGLVANIFASNKVQAFAIFKTLGGVFFLPFFAFFIKSDLKYLFGIIPNFWTFMALDELIRTGAQDYVFLGVGFATHLALLAVLFHFFNKKY